MRSSMLRTGAPCAAPLPAATRAAPLQTLRPAGAKRWDGVTAQAGVYQSSLNVQGMQPTSPKAWQIMASTLKDNNVRVIAQHELLFAVEKGAILVDVRPVNEWEAGHLENSANVPLYRLITGWTPMKALRRAGFAFFGVFAGTEPNPDFAPQLADAVEARGLGKDAPIVLICQAGGTLEPTVNMKNGKQSRALIAAYELLKLGYKNVSVLKGGFAEWKRNDRPYYEVDNES